MNTDQNRANKHNKLEILIIDDDHDYCQLVTEILSDEYKCHTAYSGTEGLNLFHNDCNHCNPSIVLVDLNLPDISGIDICSKLSQLKDEKEFAIFVITGDDGIDTRIKAFEYGADDYIAKPFEVKELISRVHRSINFVHNKKQLKIEHESTKSLANTAMAQASQYSYVMSFFKSLNSCNDIEDIARLFFDTMPLFELRASIMLSTDKEHYFGPQLTRLSPIEKNIYGLLKQKGRIYEFEPRIIFNGRNVSFLVKNLPNDPEAAGQARDFLAALIEGIEAKLDDLRVKSGLISAVGELEGAIGQVKNGIQEHGKILSSVLSDIRTDIAASYHSLDLSEEQELFFTQLVEQFGRRMNGAQGLLESVQIDLESLKDKMESVHSSSDVTIKKYETASCEIDLF